MLTGIAEIDQAGLSEMADFTIQQGGNLMVFGDAGTGKTEIDLQRVDAARIVLPGSDKPVTVRPIYLNLSVLEAPDLMGLPYRIDQVTGEGDTKVVRGKTAYALPAKFPYEDEPVAVLVADELDKARPELQNPMLELFQYRSINGTKLSIRAVLATGNLPDENAFSQPLSHALMNRCSVYRMVSNFDSWQKWAVSAAVNPLVVGFLSRNSAVLLERPAEGDDTAYAHASPRSWTYAAGDLDGAAGKSVEFQTRLVAGRVGLAAAAKFRVWLDHYRHIEPHIDALIRDGKHPGQSVITDLNRQFVFGIACSNAIMASCQRVDAASSEKDAKEARVALEKVVVNAMGWINTIPPEYAIGSVKSVLSMDDISKHKLMDINAFMAVYVEIRKAWTRP